MRFSNWLLLPLLFIPPAIFAADVIGPTYSIGEEPADKAILRVLREKQASGELKQLQKEAVARSMASAKNPKPVAGITSAKERRLVAIDASVTYPDDIKDPMGNVIVKAGTKVNPLEIMPLTRVLVFFDGKDTEQVEAVGRLLTQPGSRVRPILVSGSWLDLSKRWKQQVYFDQMGHLTQRFGVTAVPAIVRQIGNRLVMEELPAKDLKP
jgi:conjugal transfer pilus assembly protein TraW